MHLVLVHGSRGGLVVLSPWGAERGHAGGQGREFFVVSRLGLIEAFFGGRGGVRIMGFLGSIESAFGRHSFGRCRFCFRSLFVLGIHLFEGFLVLSPQVVV